MAALDFAGAVTNVKTMLSGLTAWQTICGVASSAEAAKRIHLGGCEEEEEESLAPVIILDIDPFNTNWLQSTSRGKLPIEIDVQLAVPEANQATISDQYSWVWSQAGSLLAGINGAVNGAGQLMVDSLNMSVKPGAIDPDPNHARCEWGFVLILTLEFI